MSLALDRVFKRCYTMVTVNNKEREMNERILEFARQTGLCDADGDFFGGKISQYDEFAELIVRNCIVDFYRNYLDTTSDEDITKQVDRYVKQQFGVE